MQNNLEISVYTRGSFSLKRLPYTLTASGTFRYRVGDASSTRTSCTVVVPHTHMCI